MIPQDNQHFMAKRMNAHVRSHPVDHAPLVSAPAVVVAIIREAITGVVSS